MKNVLLALLLTTAALSSACGSSASVGDGTGAEGPSGSVHVALNGAGDLAVIAIQNVFDSDQNLLVECTEKPHTLDGQAFCDELVVLPPGVYEIVVQSPDPSCRSEQDHYKVVVSPNQTTEIQINLVCGEDNGAVDTIVTEDHLPTVVDIGFDFANGERANKFMCADGGPVTITVSLDDEDTACGDLLVDWTAVADVQGDTLVFVPGSEVQPHVDPVTMECVASIAVDPAGSNPGDYRVTVEVFDDGLEDPRTATFNFPVHILEDCFPAESSVLVPGWDIFTFPGTGYVEWAVLPSGQLQVTFVTQGAFPIYSFTGGAHFFNPSNLLDDPGVTTFGPGTTATGAGLATRDGTTF